jgi:hypothetical protein
VTISERPCGNAGSRLYAIGDAARLTDYLREWIDRGIKRGKISSQRINGVRMVTLADVLADKKRRENRVEAERNGK